MSVAVQTELDVVLSVRELSVGFPTRNGLMRAVDGVSLQVPQGETLGLVGESGCGKSMTLRALMGLVPQPGGVLEGEVWFEGANLLQMRRRALREICGRRLAMVFQDPTNTLNPVLSIGSQLTEVLRVKRGSSRRAAQEEAGELLARVGISDVRRRLAAYPHQLSGGMRQRVMIALAVACEPVLLLADEPTTALDVTVQDQILALLESLKEEMHMAMIVVSHDLGMMAECADTVAVIYAGRVVEYGPAEHVLVQPRHPYTQGLIASLPSRDSAGGPRRRLRPIDGQPPNLAELPAGCAFAPRCVHVQAACRVGTRTLDRDLSDHGSACIRADELANRGLALQR